jgi:hypothetical protein
MNSNGAIHRSDGIGSFEKVLDLEGEFLTGTNSRKLKVYGNTIYFSTNKRISNSIVEHYLYFSENNGNNWGKIRLSEQASEIYLIHDQFVYKNMYGDYFYSSKNQFDWQPYQFFQEKSIINVIYAGNRIYTFNCEEMFELKEDLNDWEPMGNFGSAMIAKDPENFKEFCFISPAIFENKFLTFARIDIVQPGGTVRRSRYLISGKLDEIDSLFFTKINSFPTSIYSIFVSNSSDEILATELGYFLANGFFYSESGEEISHLEGEFPGIPAAGRSSQYIFGEMVEFRNKLFFNSTNGIWFRDLDTFPKTEEPDEDEDPILSIGKESFIDKISIYPNPASKYVTIEVKSAYIDDIFSVEIIGLDGKSILSTVATLSDNKITFQLIDYPPGLYIIQVFNRNTFVSKKLIIK